MRFLDKLLTWLLGFKGFVVPRETLYMSGIALAVISAGIIILPYEYYTLVLAFALPVLMLPLLTLPLVYKSQVKIHRRTRPGLAGSNADVELIIRNKTSIPVTIVIEDYSRTIQYSARYIVGIEGKGVKRITYSVKGRVGKHRLYSKTIIYDPLDIIGAEKKDIIEGDDSVRFKPRILEIKSTPTGYFAQIVPGGGFRSNLKGLGYDFYGLRKYVYGDPIKLVDWKTTARLRELFVKEYIIETGTRVLLALLLTNKSFTGKVSFFEEAAEALVSVINKLLMSGNSVGLVVGAPSISGLVEIGQGKTVLGSVVELLSSIPWDSHGSLNLDVFAKNILKASRYPRNTRLILVFQPTSSIEDEFYKRVLRLREVGFESVDLVIVGESLGARLESYVLLEKKGVRITRLEEMNRRVLAEEVLGLLGRR